jgi:hypothetical protein
VGRCGFCRNCPRPRRCCRYKGDWKSGKKYGYGVLYYFDTKIKIYEGNFKDDKFYGEGIYYNWIN